MTDEANRDTSPTASPQRERPEPSRTPHLLKNGHPAHVLTTEDRRRGAEAVNERRRLIREAHEDEMFERAVEELNGKAVARRVRKREAERLRRKRHFEQRPQPAFVPVSEFEPTAHGMPEGSTYNEFLARRRRQLDRDLEEI